MNFQTIFFINSAALIFIGIFGIITRKNLIKILLSINILETGVNLLLVAIGWRAGSYAPIVTRLHSDIVNFVDPLPQAMVLTAIVIAFGTTAVGLVVVINYFKSHKSLETVSFGGGTLKYDEDEVVS